MAGWNRWKDLLAPPMTRLEPGQATMIIIVMDKDQDQIPKMCRAEKAGLRSVRRALDGEQGPHHHHLRTPAGWAPFRIAAPVYGTATLVVSSLSCLNQSKFASAPSIPVTM